MAPVWRCTIETAQEPAEAARKPVTQDELLRFYSVLSHDLKSPLQAVDGFGELLMMDYADKLDDEGKDFLRRMRSSAQTMRKVLDQMTHMVKLLCRETTLKPVPLREIIEEVIFKYSMQIEEGGVRVDIPDELPTVHVDSEKVREAIGALISNALFFTDRAKGEREIKIESTTESGNVRLCIRDNGAGIDPRYVSQVFELGGVSKLDKQRGGGPGYGLYLAKRVAECHGGALAIDSTVGEGTTACMTLPA